MLAAQESLIARPAARSAPLAVRAVPSRRARRRRSRHRPATSIHHAGPPPANHQTSNARPTTDNVVAHGWRTRGRIEDHWARHRRRGAAFNRQAPPDARGLLDAEPDDDDAPGER